MIAPFRPQPVQGSLLGLLAQEDQRQFQNARLQEQDALAEITRLVTGQALNTESLPRDFQGADPLAVLNALGVQQGQNQSAVGFQNRQEDRAAASNIGSTLAADQAIPNYLQALLGSGNPQLASLGIQGLSNQHGANQRFEQQKELAGLNAGFAADRQQAGFDNQQLLQQNQFDQQAGLANNSGDTAQAVLSQFGLDVSPQAAQGIAQFGLVGDVLSTAQQIQANNQALLAQASAPQVDKDGQPIAGTERLSPEQLGSLQQLSQTANPQEFGQAIQAAIQQKLQEELLAAQNARADRESSPAARILRTIQKPPLSAPGTPTPAEAINILRHQFFGNNAEVERILQDVVRKEFPVRQ